MIAVAQPRPISLHAARVVTRAYGINSETFRAFVGTLGLRDEKDRPKPAWDEFVRQAKLIGPRH